MSAIVTENEQADCRRKIGVMVLAALIVDRRNEVADRNALSSSNALEPFPERGLHAHAGVMRADPNASFDDQGFSAWDAGLLRH
jgi:hypothetical protein